MSNLSFENFNEAMEFLANETNSKITISAEKKVDNPRKKPSNSIQEKNWNKSYMWGDPKNHKYPLFNSTTGELSAKKAKSALRYLNQARSKDFYPNIKERSEVLANIIKAINKTDPKAEIEYQPQDSMYQNLPEDIKETMTGYKQASFQEEVFLAMKSEAVDPKEVKDDVFAILKKTSSSKLEKPAKTLLKISNLGDITVAELIEKIRDAIAKPDKD